MLLYEDHQSVVYALAFSPDGTSLASGARDGSLVLRDGDQRELILESGLKSPAIHAITHLPGGALIIGHSLGWHVHRREGSTWRAFGSPIQTPTTALGVLDDHLIAVGSGDRFRPTSGKLEIWDVTAGRRMEPHFDEPNGVRAVAICPMKKLVAWATGHRQVKVWDIRKQSPLIFPQTHTTPAIALSRDGLTLAATVDWSAKLFDIPNRCERMTLKGHKGQTTAIAFSPDGSTVATGSWDQTVRLWDIGTGREITSYKWSIGKVFSLAFAPDGLRIAAGGEFGRVVVWDLE